MKVSKIKLTLQEQSLHDGFWSAEAYGVSRTRMNMILNQREVTVVCAGRLAHALGVDVTEIIED